MAIDLTIPLLMVLAFDVVVLGIASVLGYFVLRGLVRGVKALCASWQAKRISDARAEAV